MTYRSLPRDARRDTTARSRSAAIAKASEIVEDMVRSARHIFATWALHGAAIRIEDLSAADGPSSTRVTQGIWIHVRGEMYERFYRQPAERAERQR